MPKCKYCGEESEFYKNNKSKCRKCLRQYQAVWRLKNIEKSRQTSRDFTKKYRQRILEHYGRKCACCGETIEQFLSLDHKNNDGYKDRKEYGTGAMYQLCIKRGFPDTYQILCYNCNHAKAIYGKCPHQT